MLHSLKGLRGTAVEATDGAIGTLDRFLIDIDHWAIRYLIVETGDWWDQHDVLISPLSVGRVLHEDREIQVSLTRAQVRSSPEYDPTRPLTREHETTLLGHYGHPPYWTGPFLWGPLPAATAPAGLSAPGEPPARTTPAAVLDEVHGDLGLVDSLDVFGTHLHATDGDIGHVEDFLVEDDTWSLRYLVVDTSNWWIGKQVLISPDWIDRLDWPNGKLHVGMDRASVKGAPEYDASTPPSREMEEALFEHHHRPPYWIE